MLARVDSFVLIGIDAIRCEVEADVSQRGLSKVTLVGLPQAAVKESIERVRRSIINCGFAFPMHAVAINLAPADVKKEGPALDLPIALAVLQATGFIKGEVATRFLIAGELALDGRLRKIKGGLPMALLAKDRKYEGVIVPLSRGSRSFRWRRSRRRCSFSMANCRSRRTSWMGSRMLHRICPRIWISPMCAGRKRSSER
jgi:magnesium chelatase family protein